VGTDRSSLREGRKKCLEKANWEGKSRRKDITRNKVTHWGSAFKRGERGKEFSQVRSEIIKNASGKQDSQKEGKAGKLGQSKEKFSRTRRETWARNDVRNH